MAEDASGRRVDPLQRLVQLGRTKLKISPMGVGCWAWGDKFTWGYNSADPQQERAVGAAVEASLAAGVTLFDTAEAYGGGISEKLVGAFTSKAGPAAPGGGAGAAPPVVATKYLPLPWHLNAKRSLEEHLRASLARLGTDSVDLYQIHGPALSLRPVEALAGALADAYDLGLARAVGVSNFNEAQLRRAHAVLAKRGVPLASNQVEYSLLRRHPETSGLLAACDELGVTLLAYSPLAMGRLTGKYSAADPPPGLGMRRFGSVPMNEVDPLLAEMRAVGAAHGGKTPAQVALNWCMCKGTVPIPGAKNSKQAEDNAGALGWSLTGDEVERLDSLGKVGSTSMVWQHG